MKHFNKLAFVVASALCSANVVAADISGIVTDKQGNPIAGAKVTLEGSRIFAITDQQGRYALKDVPEHAHLHVATPNHIHGDRELDEVTADRVENFQLAESNIENVTVTAYAMQRSLLESTTPVSILAGESLYRAQAPTLGDMLSGLPGVHSTYFGPVSSSPIIRGADGPRVKVVQNGLDASDASRIGPDHNVAVEGSQAQQIEVLRGPATLLYGNGAIGGVVNIVDNRIPTELYKDVEGEAELRYDSVSDEKFARVDVNGSAGQFAFHLDGFDRRTNDYEIPGFAESEPHEEDEPGILPNSAIDNTSLTGGVSYIGESGFIGFSAQTMDNLYGVPGHAHGHADEHGDEHEGEEHGEEGHSEEEEFVQLDVEMERYQLAGEWLSPMAGISNIKFAAGYTDYQHTELEGDEIGTVFSNETIETRITAEHNEFLGWHGVFGLQYNNIDFAAVGAEAYTPPSETDSIALFIMEEKRFGDVTVQLGARYDASDVKPLSDVEFDLEAHDEHHEDEEHEGEEHEGEEHGEEGHDEHEEQVFTLNEQSYNSLSFSAGLNWQYLEGQSVAFSISHSERAPSHQELFSAGEHIATRTFDVGALFSIDEDGELMLRDGGVEEETATNLDLTFRKFDGDWGYTVSIFYNQVDDYLFQFDTGLEAAGGHGHEDEHDEEHEGEEHGEEGHDEYGDEEGMPVLLFAQQDAKLYGIEAEVFAQLNDTFRVQLFADSIRGSLDRNVAGIGRNLPRIPPTRVGANLSFVHNAWDGDIGVTWHDDQDRTSQFETATDGYTLVDATLNYRQTFNDMDWVFYLRGRNLTDREARVHTSFIKDDAPLPGRSVAVGVRAHF